VWLTCEDILLDQRKKSKQISGSWFRASAITTTNKIQQDAQ
jgi:hypothetical protein